MGSASTNKISFHFTYFFSFATHLLFFCSTEKYLPSTTPHPRFLFCPDSKKKNRNLFKPKCLVLSPSIPKKKTKVEKYCFPKKTRHTTHNIQEKRLTAHLLIWGVLRVLLRHRFQCLIQHLKWSHLLFMSCIHGSKPGFIKWPSSIFNSILEIRFFQNVIDQFQNICGIWPNWFWNCFCCLTCQLTQHLTVFLSWKVVCLFWHKLCFCDWEQSSIVSGDGDWGEKIFVVVFSLFCWQSLFDAIGPVVGVTKSKVLFLVRDSIFGPILFDLLSFKVAYFIWHSCQGLSTSDEEEQSILFW